MILNVERSHINISLRIKKNRYYYKIVKFEHKKIP